MEKDMMCIKSNDQNVPVKDNDVKERWREYFSKLLNEDYIGDIKNNTGYSVSKTYFFLQNLGGGSE